MEHQALLQITPTHYLFMNSMYEVASIEADLVIRKCNQLKKRILELESKTPDKSQPIKKAAPVYLTDNIIQFPGERRGAHAN